jgi:hypothetical protein
MDSTGSGYDLAVGSIEQGNYGLGWSQWPLHQRRRSAYARLLRLWVPVPPEAWIFVCCECRVLSGRGLCDELITRPEESHRLWCVVVCDLETSGKRRPRPALARSATGEREIERERERERENEGLESITAQIP